MSSPWDSIASSIYVLFCSNGVCVHIICDTKPAGILAFGDQLILPLILTYVLTMFVQREPDWHRTPRYKKSINCCCCWGTFTKTIPNFTISQRIGNLSTSTATSTRPSMLAVSTEIQVCPKPKWMPCHYFIIYEHCSRARFFKSKITTLAVCTFMFFYNLDNQ